MISSVNLYLTASQYAKSGTSGYISDDDFNRNISFVEKELINFICPFYETNQAVRELLGPFVIPYSGNSSADGLVAKPAGYVQSVRMSVSGVPSVPININEVDMIKTSPIREPDVAERRVYHYFEGDGIYVLPESVNPVSMSYIRMPVFGSIELTAVSTADSDLVTPVSVTDLEWPERAFNIILYMVLEKMGVSMKEQLLLEFSNLGINREAGKIAS